LGSSASKLAEALELSSRLSKEFSRLYVYASMMSDQDTRVSSYQGMQQEMAQVGATFGAETSYMEPEILKLEASKVTKVTLASQRALELERLKTGDIEVRLFRKSGLVSKTRYTSRGCMAILGGEKESKDSFFVVVRSDEPVIVD